mgnify:CR=1 FL=1
MNDDNKVIKDFGDEWKAYDYQSFNNEKLFENFEQYFSKYPHIFRKNRTSVAVLDGKETEAELLALGNDVFDFFVSAIAIRLHMKVKVRWCIIQC